MNFNVTVYSLFFDFKGFPYIEQHVLADRVRDFAEMTTSPRGVMPKMFVEENSIFYWLPNGKKHLIEKFDSQKDAEQSWLERTYINDYYRQCTNDFDSMEQVICFIADAMNLHESVVVSLLHHHELYREIESKIKARRIMQRYYNAKRNSNGVETKKLRQARDAARYPSCYMYGRSLPFDSPRLSVEKYYTEDFKNELGL